MSFESWCPEHYPVDANVAATDDVAACEHSLRKWRGLRKEALAAHELVVNEAVLYEKDFEDFEEWVLSVNAKTCALCLLHVERTGSCETCPLYEVRGRPCDELRDGEKDSPYFTFSCCDDPEPMIGWLEKALEFAKAKK